MKMTERAWAAQVDDLALINGWRGYGVLNSTRVVRRRSGAIVRATNIIAGGKGFPDRIYVRVRDVRMVIVELKQDGRYPEPAQREWLADLKRIAHAIGDTTDRLMLSGSALAVKEPFGRLEIYVWRPSDVDQVVEVLA